MKEGKLMKLGHVRENWNERYFVCDGKKLQYFTDHTKTQSKGTYTLEKTSTVQEYSVPGKTHCFCLNAHGESKGLFSGSNDRLVMQADSYANMMSWLEYLGNSISVLQGSPPELTRSKTDAQPKMAPPKSSAVDSTPKPLPTEQPKPAPVKKTTPPKILILGSSGSIGKATITSLYATIGGKIPILAGVRDASSSKYDALKLPGVELVTADMSKPETLLAAMADDVSVVYVIAPGTEDRADLAIAAVKACVDANVPHVVVLSVTTTVVTPLQIFGAQFGPVEDFTKNAGISYTILRFPFFLDNYLGQVSNMIEQGQFYTPISSDALHNDVAVCDAGEASAVVLASPGEFVNRTLVLSGALFSEKMVADAFSSTLERPVVHIQVPPEASKESMLGMGFPEWQVDGILELYQGISTKLPIFTSTPDDLGSLLDRAPLTIAQFAKRFGPPPIPLKTNAVDDIVVRPDSPIVAPAVVKQSSQVNPEEVAPNAFSSTTSVEPEEVVVNKTDPVPLSEPVSHQTETETSLDIGGDVFVSKSDPESSDPAVVPASVPIPAASESSEVLKQEAPPASPTASNLAAYASAAAASSSSADNTGEQSDEFSNGVWALKREGEGGVYHNRFVWIDRGTGRLHWSKVDDKSMPSKSVAILQDTKLSDIKQAVKQRRASFIGTSDTAGFSFLITPPGGSEEPAIGLKFVEESVAFNWKMAIKTVASSTV